MLTISLFHIKFNFMKLKLKQVYMLNLLDLKKLLFMTNFAEKK